MVGLEEEGLLDGLLLGDVLGLDYAAGQLGLPAHRRGGLLRHSIKLNIIESLALEKIGVESKREEWKDRRM